MYLKTLVLIWVGFIPLICSQTCKPHPKNAELADLIVESTVVVQVSLKNQPELTKAQRKQLRNVTGSIVGIWPTYNGGLKKRSKITFGPIGKSGGCEDMKVDGTSYLLFLSQPNKDDFYSIIYNPLKASKKTLRKVRKLLCKGCLVPPSFKKKSKQIAKKEGEKVKLKCKASGKPKPAMMWYYNNEQLTKSNKQFKIKTSKRGGSTSLQIKRLTPDHNNSVFVCRAKNAVSDVPANYTITIKVSEVNLIVQCDIECDEKYANYCIHGSCCSDISGGVRCICNGHWNGKRCDTKIPKAFTTYQESEDIRHQQRLVALLGVCLAVLVILFICFAIYCLFSKKRYKLHRKILLNKFSSIGTNNSETSPMIKHHDTDVGISGTSFTERTNQSQPESSRDEVSRQYPLPLHMNGTDLTPENVDESSTVAILDHSQHSRFSARMQISSVSSMNGNGSKRQRLNGLAKSGSRHFSVKQSDESRKSLSQSSTPIMSKIRLDSNTNNNNCGSTSSLNNNETLAMPSSPSAPNLPSRQASDYDEFALQSGTKSHQQYLPSQSCHSPHNSSKHTMKTFGHDSDIQKENLYQDEESPLSGTSLLPISSSQHFNHALSHQKHGSSMPTSVNSPPITSPSNHKRFFSDQQNTAEDYHYRLGSSNHPLSCENIALSNQHDTAYLSPEDTSTYPTTASAKSSVGDHDDLFRGVVIPDTSLELYSGSSPQNLKRKHSTQPKVDFDGFRYPQPSTQLCNTSVASAQLHQLPLLSKQSHSRSDDVLINTNTSLTSDDLTDNESNLDNSESPKILV